MSPDSPRVTSVAPEPLRHLVALRRAHDWFYEFSDDQRVYRSGEAERRVLLAAGYVQTPGYGTGDLAFRAFAPFCIRDSLSFWVGHLAWRTLVKQGAHWGDINLSGAAVKRLGHSTTISVFALSPLRKEGASADTVYSGQTIGTWAAWTDVLQSVYDVLSVPGALHYWELVGSA